MSTSFIDIAGKKFGRLTVLKQTDRRASDGNVIWFCRCECGKRVFVRSANLRRGATRSCGCFHKDCITTHGLSKTKEYQSWFDAKKRCYDKKCSDYANWGGRGIEMCAHWRGSFIAFYEDMGPCPSGLTLERKDNSKGYVIGNCKWATRKEQANNRRKRLQKAA